MRVSRTAALAATLGGAAIAICTVPSALAAPGNVAPGRAAASGTEHFVVSIGLDAKAQSVIATGLFTGGGKDDGANNNYDVLTLGGGTLRITHPIKKSHFSSKINKKTCAGTFTLSGRYTLGDGTGKYKTVTGHGTYKGTADILLARAKSGACTFNKQPVAEIGVIRASGPATLK